MRVCRAVTAFLITVKGVRETFGFFFSYWCVGKSLWVASSVGSLDIYIFFDKGEGKDGRCDVMCGVCFCFVKKVYDVEDERREEKRRGKKRNMEKEGKGRGSFF